MNNDSRLPAPNPAGPTRFRILDVELDSGRQTVTRDGVELHVPKLSFDLLLTLARAAPNVVSAAELMERVWPRQLVGVETVAQRVKLLRQALADDAQHPRYLSGERRRGYRIIAPVIALAPETPPTIATHEPPAEPPTASALSSVPAPASAAVAAAPAGTPATPARRRVGAVLLATTVVILVAALIDLIGRGSDPDARGNIASLSGPYSVAVLPFRGVSGRRDDELLGSGISDLVINRLTGNHDLLVIASDSALRPRADSESAVETGRRLRAHYVIDGSVQREGSQVRVTADLIDVPEGRHVGALLVERPTSDLFRLQDDIAERVNYLLLGKTHPEQPPTQQFGTDAMLAYLRGRALLATRKASDADSAVQEFTQAITLAPAFASAYAGRAEARFQSRFLSGTYQANGVKTWQEMLPDIERALQLDPGNGPATFIHAKYRELTGDSAGAESEYRRAMALSPTFAPGVAYFADFLAHGLGKSDEALAIIDAALPVNPLAPRLIYLKASIVRDLHHDDSEVADLLLRTIQVDPDYYAAYIRLAQLRWNEGRLADAIGFAEASVRVDPRNAWSLETLARLYVDLGDLIAARAVLAHSDGYSDGPRGPALMCYRAGHLDAAVAYLRPSLLHVNANLGAETLAATITALIEQAARSGNYAEARALLVKTSWLTDEHGSLVYSMDNALSLLQLATLEKLAGHRAEAERIATRVLALHEDPTSLTAGDSERIRMLALALLGRDPEALAILEANRDTKARVLWWIWIERHPAFATLRHDPRVRQLLAELHAWSGKQRELVDASRQAGRLPVRTQVTPDPCALPLVAKLLSPTS